MGDEFVFVGEHPTAGVELWTTDGTPQGTHLLVDLCPGYCSSAPRSLLAIADRLYFVASDGVHGEEIFSTDGTAAGTELVADVWPGPESSAPQRLGQLGGAVLFSAYRPTSGWELWRSDGSTQGTVRLTDLPEDRGWPHFSWPVSTHDVAVFAVRNASGTSLWSTDGSPIGTQQLRDFSAGRLRWPFQAPSWAVLDDSVFFFADDGSGVRLWQTDGTAAGTRAPPPLAIANGGGVTLGGRVVASTGTGLLFTDGVDTETVTVPGWPSGGCRFDATGRAGSHLFFSCVGDLWVTDGTGPGTLRLTTSAPGARPPFFAFDGGVVFYGGTGYPYETWFSDGTVAGTHRLQADPGDRMSQIWHALEPGRDQPLLLTGHVSDAELWTTDGTASGTTKLWPLRYTSSSFPLPLSELAPGQAQVRLGTPYRFQDPDYLVEPGQPPVRLADVSNMDTRGLFYGTAVEYQDRWLLRSFSQDITGKMLFPPLQSVDRQLGNARALVAPHAVYLEVFADELIEFGGVWSGAPFRVDPDGGPLLAIPGPQSFVPQFANQHPGYGSPYRFGFYGLQPLVSSSMLFLPSAQGLWTLDPQLRATDWAPHLQEVDAFAATPSGPLFLSAKTPANGREVYSFDPAAAQLTLLEVRAGPGAGVVRQESSAYGLLDEPAVFEPFQQPAHSAVLGDLFFFAGDDGTSGIELWATTPAGPPFLVLDIEPGPASSYPTALTRVDDTLFFRARDAAHGVELWTSDGTAAGTRRVLDARPGSASALPQELLAVDGRLLFTQFTDKSGRELWISDGTPAGTRQLGEIAAGAESSSPMELLVTGPRVLFQANDGVRGFELWALERPVGGGPQDLFATGFESAALGDWSAVEP